jgi:hypothetical protein
MCTCGEMIIIWKYATIPGEKKVFEVLNGLYLQILKFVLENSNRVL